MEAAERAGIAGRTAFVVTGDHGFVDVHTQVNPNVWLAAAGAALGPAAGGAHGYFPDLPDIHTGLIGWGAGFRPGAVAPLFGQEDVAPLVAELLGLACRAPDGVLHAGLLDRRDR